jgi:hypothetical protein
MRLTALVLAVFVWVCPSWCQDAKDKVVKRYQTEAKLEDYPQDAAKKTLESVIKAIGASKIDYVLAHLADPKFVDARVSVLNDDFDALVKETTNYLANDPTILKELKRFAKEGEWEEGDGSASVYLKENKDRRAFMKKIGNRWFLENRQK